LTAGVTVFPVLAIGDDPIGREIRDQIGTAASAVGHHEGLEAFLSSKRFFASGLRTPQSVILVENRRRTIFSEATGSQRSLIAHLKACLAYFEREMPGPAKALVIGHIRPDGSTNCIDQPGHCTKHLVDSFYRKAPIYLNFGDSQIRLGLEFWRDTLPKATIFQLNLAEIKALFRAANTTPSLEEIVEWFQRQGITTVITLDKFGALGSYGHGREGLVFARPHYLEGVIDPTGAGDAFGAGMISYLVRGADFTFDRFRRAVDEARAWAAIACRQPGGAAHCPTRGKIDRFRRRFRVGNHSSLEVVTGREATRVLRKIDR
jgi:sugar/nucleoside kinase (ribokinase family)